MNSFSHFSDTAYKALMKRHVLLVEYLGMNYCGSQYQHQDGEIRPTIQHTLEKGLKALGLEASKISFSSRTDAGVHAVGQCAHFDLPKGALETFPHLPMALNSMLSKDVSVRDAVYDVGLDFHSRREASRKWYRYTLFNAPQRSAMCPDSAVWWKYPLDITTMNQASKLFVGTHNFKSVKCPNTLVVDDVCCVEYANVIRDGDFIHFDVVATRFLYKMVRNLMGLLLAVGRNKNPISPETVLDVLEKQDRPYASQYGATAKPGGLTLMAIGYPEHINYFKNDTRVQEMNRLVTMELPDNENLFCKAS